MTRGEAMLKAVERSELLGVDYVVVAVPNEQLAYTRCCAIRLSSWEILAPAFPECRELDRIAAPTREVA